jgi:hypothetical protein
MIIELPPDELSERLRKLGIDDCPVRLTGIDRLRANRAHKGKRYTLEQIEAERAKRGGISMAFARMIRGLLP